MHKLTVSYRRIFHLFILVATLSIIGCATTKNAASRDAIANLKTAHLAYIDEFTEGAGKTWDDQKLASSTAALEKQFSDAEEAAATKADARRKTAIANLHARFKRHAEALKSRKAFFKPKAAEVIKGPLALNYDQALSGEDAR